jgi:RimJ/RimL family protein N-acetyltransferase
MEKQLTRQLHSDVKKRHSFLAILFHAGELQRGCKTATLRASPANARTTAFYKKLGWAGLGQDQEHSRVHKYTINL